MTEPRNDAITLLVCLRNAGSSGTAETFVCRLDLIARRLGDFGAVVENDDGRNAVVGMPAVVDVACVTVVETNRAVVVLDVETVAEAIVVLSVFDVVETASTVVDNNIAGVAAEDVAFDVVAPAVAAYVVVVVVSVDVVVVTHVGDLKQN
jgi:hypothetical protein